MGHAQCRRANAGNRRVLSDCHVACQAPAKTLPAASCGCQRAASQSQSTNAIEGAASHRATVIDGDGHIHRNAVITKGIATSKCIRAAIVDGDGGRRHVGTGSGARHDQVAAIDRGAAGITDRIAV